MRKLIFTLMFACCSYVSLNAQTKFLDRLTQNVAGQGSVTITQDKRLTDLINGTRQQPVAAAPAQNAAGASASSEKLAQDEDDDTTPGTAAGKKTKVRGFRIQVYWGGSQRIHQTKAQQAAEKVATLFPEYQTYTSFESPHWRCRVGDFIDRQKAWEALKRLREAGVASDAMIVRSEIYIYQ